MFRHHAKAVGSYSIGLPAAGSARTKSTRGFILPEWSPCTRLREIPPCSCLTTVNLNHGLYQNRRSIFREYCIFATMLQVPKFQWVTESNMSEMATIRRVTNYVSSIKLHTYSNILFCHSVLLSNAGPSSTSCSKRDKKYWATTSFGNTDLGRRVLVLNLIKTGRWVVPDGLVTWECCCGGVGSLGKFLASILTCLLRSWFRSTFALMISASNPQTDIQIKWRRSASSPQGWAAPGASCGRKGS